MVSGYLSFLLSVTNTRFLGSTHVLSKNNTSIEGKRRLEDGDRAKDYSGASQSRKAATQAYEL
jgi:hypothetical protein